MVEQIVGWSAITAQRLAEEPLSDDYKFTIKTMNDQWSLTINDSVIGTQRIEIIKRDNALSIP